MGQLKDRLHIHPAEKRDRSEREEKTGILQGGMSERINIAIIGRGYVANMHWLMPMHDELAFGRSRLRTLPVRTRGRLTGARTYSASRRWPPIRRRGSCWTNPSAHHATSKALLEAGRHAYSERPLAMQLDHAHETDLAQAVRGSRETACINIIFSFEA